MGNSLQLSPTGTNLHLSGAGTGGIGDRLVEGMDLRCGTGKRLKEGVYLHGEEGVAPSTLRTTTQTSGSRMAQICAGAARTSGY